MMNGQDRRRRLAILRIAGLMLLLTSPACPAGKLLIAEQGMAPNRVAMFADDYTIESVGSVAAVEAPTRTYIMRVTNVYEADAKPYWTEMELAFKCRNALHEALQQKRQPREVPAATADVATVAEFSLLSGKTRAKNKVDHVPLSPAPWTNTSNAMMVQARNVACNMEALKAALRAARKPDRRIDFGTLSRAVTGMGLELVRPMPEDMSSYDFLADAAWPLIWPDASKPAVDRGRQLTDEESRQLDARMTQVKQRIQSAQSIAENHLQQTVNDREFTTKASAFRNGRRLNKIERILLPAWESQSRDELRQDFGDPVRVEQGQAGSIYLTYLGIFDNRNLVQTTRRLSSTVMFNEMMQTGYYKDCQVQFIMIPDNGGIMRVADVRVEAWHSQKGYSAASKDLCATALGIQ